MANIARIVGDNIARLRLKSGMSQDALAAKLKVEKLTVYRWEKAKAWPTAKNIEALAGVFAVPPSDLFVPSERTTKVTKATKNTRVAEALGVIAAALGHTIRPRRK